MATTIRCRLTTVILARASVILPAKRRSSANTDSAATARRIVDILADRQAEDVVLLDITTVAPFADYFVIATAENPRQMRALVETVERELRDEGVTPWHEEGEVASGWVLVDYGDVIVHLFSPELRGHYGLEELWRTATQVVRIQ